MSKSRVTVFPGSNVFCGFGAFMALPPCFESNLAVIDPKYYLYLVAEW